MKLAAAVLSFFILPLAEASEMAPPALASAVQQLRQAAGLWNVTTTQYGDDGAVARVASGTYRFDWIVPDRVLAGRSDIPDWGDAAGILFYVNERRSTIEMASVGADGHLWVMTGPANGETRSTPDTSLADGRKMKLPLHALECQRRSVRIADGSERRRRRELEARQSPVVPACTGQ